jgi:hypothetical protein
MLKLMFSPVILNLFMSRKKRIKRKKLLKKTQVNRIKLSRRPSFMKYFPFNLENL